MAIKMYGKRIRATKVSWISLKRNRVPLKFLLSGVVCMTIALLCIPVSEETEYYIALCDIGSFFALSGALCGLGLNLVLPTAPKYIVEEVESKGEG